MTRARVLADMRRKEAEAADKRKRDEDKLKAEAEAVEKVKRDMKGKKFTLDERGNPIQVRRVNAATLPPAFVDVDLSVPLGDADHDAIVSTGRHGLLLVFW